MSISNNIFGKLYNSPTFTTWGIHAVRFIDILIVIPLLLNYFDSVQLAAFLLFESIFEFSSLFSQRISKTFSRVVAFANSGAKTLNPIKNTTDKRSTGGPNYEVLRDIWQTMTFCFLILSFVSLFICLGIGSFGVTNLLDNNTLHSEIWEAFILVLTSTFFFNLFIAFESYLIGLSKVPEVNRLTIFLRVLSLIIVLVTIKNGCSFIFIVGIMQAFRILSGFLKGVMLAYYARSLNDFKLFSISIEKNVLSAILEPTWRAMISVISSTGVRQFSGVIFTSTAEPSIVATYLFGLRIITSLGQVAQAPFSSLTPYFAKLRSENKLIELRNKFQERIFICLLLFSIGSLLIAFISDFAFSLIEANIEFMSIDIWLLWSLVFLYERLITFSIAVCESGNQVLFYLEEVLTGLGSLGLLFWLPNELGVIGIIFSFAIPRILFFRLRPIMTAAKSLDVKPRIFLEKRTILVFLVHTSIYFIYLLYF